MPYNFEAAGWRDSNDNRHRGLPKDPTVVKGIWVSVKNPDDPDDTHMFWAYRYEPFQTWGEWWVYIGALMEAHGMSLADDGPDDDEPPDDGDDDAEDGGGGSNVGTSNRAGWRRYMDDF